MKLEITHQREPRIRTFEEYDKNKIYMTVSKTVKRHESAEFHVHGVVAIITDGKLKQKYTCIKITNDAIKKSAKKGAVILF